jgi:hypothetical protein
LSPIAKWHKYRGKVGKGVDLGKNKNKALLALKEKMLPKL